MRTLKAPVYLPSYYLSAVSAGESVISNWHTYKHTLYTVFPYITFPISLSPSLGIMYITYEYICNRYVHICMHARTPEHIHFCFEFIFKIFNQNNIYTYTYTNIYIYSLPVSNIFWLILLFPCLLCESKLLCRRNKIGKLGKLRCAFGGKAARRLRCWWRGDKAFG